MDYKISIVTAVFNGNKTLERLINSIRMQQDTNVEFIIIDGGSTDGTLDIISSNSDIINYWVSDRDKGIYDAWNKGIEAASGDWIMFLGCDDILLPNALKDYRKYLDLLPAAKSYDLISSQLEMIDSNETVIRIKGSAWKWPKYLREVTIAHPGALHSSNLFKTYGLYDITYKIVGDFELILRPRNNLKAAFMNIVTVQMSEGGASDSFKAIVEHYRAATSTGQYSKILGGLNVAVVFSKLSLKKIYSFFRLEYISE